MGAYRISELARRTGLPATTLRYYEKERLLPSHRTPAGYREYTDADADRVQFISAAKHLGLPLQQIRDLLEVWDGGMCREIRDELRPMVATQIAAADQRIQDLQTFRERLRSALMHLHDLPAKDGPCDPACAFLRDLPDRVPARGLQPRSAPHPLLQEDTTEIASAAVACSLDDGRYDDRAARWREVLGDAPRVRTATGGVTVQLPAAQASVAADLVVAEQECCPFFTFHLDFVGATVELTADAPTRAQPLLAALFGVGALPAEEPQDLC